MRRSALQLVRVVVSLFCVCVSSLSTAPVSFAAHATHFRLVQTTASDDTVLRIRTSPNGKLLASLSPYGVTVRRIQDNETVHTFTTVGAFAFSPDSRLIATAGADSTDHVIRIWNVATGVLVHAIQLDGTYAEDVAFTPNGKQLLAIGQTTITSWRVRDWSQVWSIVGDEDAVRSIRVSPNGATFATTNQTGQVKIWRTADHTFLRAFGEQSWGGDTVSYSADGKRIATVGLDEIVRIWNVRTGALTGQIAPQGTGSISVGFSSSADLIAVGSLDNTITLWNTTDYTQVQTLVGHENPVNSFAFHPRGDRLFSGGSDATIKIWRDR